MEHLTSQLCRIMPTAITGSVVRTEGAAAAVAGFPAPVGSLAEICHTRPALRRKLKHSAAQIETVTGVGYRLVEGTV